MRVALEFEKIAGDIPGSEGPCVTAAGRIFLVSPPQGRILEYREGSGVSELVTYKGAPAGLQTDPEGNLWVADMMRGIVKVSSDGEVIPIVETFEGQPMRGCNDLAFDSVGNLYFTAPAGSSADHKTGEVFCRLSDGRVHRLAGGFAFSNGIAVSADDRTLVVAETFTRSLIAFSLEGPGLVESRRVFAVMSGSHRVGADGMDFDERGRLISTNYGEDCLDVLLPDGTLERRVDLPFARPSNVHFAGPRSRTLLITEHSSNSLWRTTWDCAGQAQFGWPPPHSSLKPL